jgi:predicted dehydrogenase
MSDIINIAIFGLGFGAEFIPIYQRHPHANIHSICQRSERKLNQIGDAFGVEKRYTDFDDVLQDPQVDAVHINTPIPDHAPQSIKALKGGAVVKITEF